MPVSCSVASVALDLRDLRLIGSDYLTKSPTLKTQPEGREVLANAD